MGIKRIVEIIKTLIIECFFCNFQIFIPISQLISLSDPTTSLDSWLTSTPNPFVLVPIPRSSWKGKYTRKWCYFKNQKDSLLPSFALPTRHAWVLEWASTTQSITDNYNYSRDSTQEQRKFTLRFILITTQ